MKSRSQRHLREFTNLQRRLMKRRESLCREIALLDRALEPPPQSIKTPKPKQLSYHCRKRAYGALTQAVKGALSNGPKTKREILLALERAGVPLGGAPLEVLDSVVYTKHFIRNGKLFSLAIPHHS
jgi:hypothetical protein